MNILNFFTGTPGSLQIRPGTTSSAETLNAYHLAVSQDIAAMAASFQEAIYYGRLLERASEVQSSAIRNIAAELNNRVDTLTASSMALVDMHSRAYIHEDSTASINHEYGQATLPVLSSTNLLKRLDAFGEYRAVDNVKFWWAAKEHSESPTIDDYQYINNINDFLIGKSWLLLEWPKTDPAYTDLYLRVDLPTEFFGLRPNMLELKFAPPFQTTLKEIAYQTEGQSLESSWTPITMDYLTGYNNSLYGNSYVNHAASVRVQLPDQRITSLRLTIRPDKITSWGLAHFGLINEKYDLTGVLKVVNPYESDISSYYLKGKDLSDLNELTGTINGSETSITISTNNYHQTPIITGVVLEI